MTATDGKSDASSRLAPITRGSRPAVATADGEEVAVDGTRGVVTRC